MCGDMVCRGIRELDADGSVTLVGGESHPPYKRPPLTKDLWKHGDESKIWRAEQEIDLRTGRRIASVDPSGRATDDTGEEYRWEQLILATGGTPRRLGGDDGDVVYFRTLDDYHRLHSLAEAGKRFVVIGGGFIGSEIAAALNGKGCDVTMVFPEPGIGFRLFPGPLAEFVNGYYRERGIEVLTGETVSSVDGTRVTLGSGTTLESDGVIAGLGILPATELAYEAGLAVDNGVVVDEYGRAEGHEHVFAAGDVANFPSPVLGASFRVEHEDHANSHGKLVGRNAAGEHEVYDHIPFFYSDLFDLGYEAVGEVDSRLATVEWWTEPNRKGVVAYVDNALRPRGLLLWNVWGKVDAARDLIRAGEPVDELRLGEL
jgi:3-phenylpropionate/trans-cinnamate dioxygenase ferredoxin reductase component